MDDPPESVTMTITPRTSTVLRLADRIARRHGHGYVGTEHLLLALIEEGEGIAGQVLLDIGAAGPARDRTERILASPPYQGSTGPGAPSASPLRLTVPVASGLRSPIDPEGP